MPRQLKKPWLTSFLDYTNNTEIPRDWLVWAGISALSNTLKRNVFITYRNISFYPNQYVVLVGPPGIGKGEAISYCTRLTNAAKTVNYLTDWSTPQQMIDEIYTGWSNIILAPGQISTGNIIVDRCACILGKELAVVLQSYDNLHSILCEWWDQSEFTYKTKNKGKYTIDSMCISILAACVPDYVRSLSKDRLAPITGGFTARTIFVYASEKYQLLDHSFGKQTFIQNQLENDLVNDLRHINSLTGELCLDKEAEKLWQKTYQIHNKQGNFDSDASANFKSRISSHIIKTAIAISISESDNLIITVSQLARAIGYIESVRDKVDVVFRSVGESPIAVGQARILDFIKMKGQASYKEILKYNYKHVTNEQLTSILSVLTYSDEIYITTVNSADIYNDGGLGVTLASKKGAGVP